MNRIFLKSMAVAFSSLAASVLLALIIVPAIGGSIDGNAWLMLTICPLAIAWPASAFTFWQGEKLKRAHGDLARAHAELADAHAKLEEKSRRDPMTGMLNRETFFAALDRSRRKSDRGALLIIDADHFKKINDSFGHLTGDKALLEIAAAISRAVRSGDILGRIGGEEFAAFLMGASDQEAIRVAERVRHEVELIRFQPMDERVVPLTVSIGGTICRSEANVSELMRAADKHLYEAKNRGRNLAIFDVHAAA
ncbi:GGDEF domain-containing protein [Mesorhizobium sp. VNQ89]|uniref:GGDEF domain-containing protein n=1 Tax=Mesorhizobium quangtriensis TaxID=3157709 RepID=UPI0032B71307